MDFKATGSGFFRDPGAQKAEYPAKFSRRDGRGGQKGFGRIPVSELDETSRALFDAVQMLYGMLMRENNLVKQFLTARERVQEIEATTGRHVPSLRVVVHANAVPAGCHVRVYNDAASTNGEVAANVPQSDLDVPSMPKVRDIPGSSSGMLSSWFARHLKGPLRKNSCAR